MKSKIKNIIIILVLVGVLVLGYIFFIKGNSDQANLTSSAISNLLPSNDVSTNNIAVDSEFVTTLLSVKNIKLNNSIFSSTDFLNLRDSSIGLVQDGNEGRKNPFAPIGSDVAPKTNVNTTTDNGAKNIVTN
jgi:regulatory protein YycI of two-component signal transduction system YycFG